LAFGGRRIHNGGCLRWWFDRKFGRFLPWQRLVSLSTNRTLKITFGDVLTQRYTELSNDFFHCFTF
jgi:hypothetical protein